MNRRQPEQEGATPAQGGEVTPARRVSLVLGAGGARGYAHIGAIQVLLERGYEIAAVTGSSMGALVGGIFAAGRLEELADWAVGLHQRDVARMADLSRTRSGLMRAERVLERVRELVGARRIEDLAVPFTAVATDLLAGREVWFQRGPLDVAIRASIALPGIFTPVTINGRLLVDGGLMEPLPVAPAAAVPADLTVAVSLTGERDLSAAVAHETADPGPFDEWVSRFRRGAAQMFSAIGAPAAAEGQAAAVEASETVPSNLSALEIITYAYEAMQRVIDRYRLAGFPPDVLISIPKDACLTVDFHRAAPMVELGRNLAAAALDAYEIERTQSPE